MDPYVLVAQGKLDIMGVQHADAADLVLQGQSLGLELDTVIARDVGPHIHLGGFLQIRMAVFEDDFRVADGETVHVVLPPAQDKGTVVQAEIGRIKKEYLANAGARLFERFAGKVNPSSFRRSLHVLGKVLKGIHRREAIALEDYLDFEVLESIEWMAIAIFAFLDFGYWLGLGLGRCGL